MTEYEEVIEKVQSKTKYDETIIKSLVLGLEKAVQLLPQPSTLRCMLMVSLQMAIEKFYGFNINISDEC